MEKIYIALSASFYTDPEVKTMLSLCEQIYTTQRRNIDELEKMFGHCVFTLPYATPPFMEYLKKYIFDTSSPQTLIHFITYSNLFAIKDRKKTVNEIMNMKIFQCTSQIL